MTNWRLLFLSFAFLVAQGTAHAATSFCGSAGLDVYTSSGFTCNIGDKTFSDFAAILTSVNASPGAESSILVIPGGTSTDPSFSFVGSFSASGAAASETLTILYTATAPVGSTFTGNSLSLTGASVTGLAAITASEALCLGGSFTSPTLPLVCSSGVTVNSTLTADITNGNLGATINYNFSPVTTLGVVKKITLTGALGGTASASALNNVLAATVPEPSTWIMTLAGIVLLAMSRLRRANRAPSANT